MAEDEQVEVIRVEAESRYELLVGGVRVGFLAYDEEPGRLVLLHTEIDPERSGHGLAGRLVDGVLTDVRARGLHIRPLCPYVAAYLRRHPEDRDLVG